jgi:hypothetical protein
VGYFLVTDYVSNAGTSITHSVIAETVARRSGRFLCCVPRCLLQVDCVAKLKNELIAKIRGAPVERGSPRLTADQALKRLMNLRALGAALGRGAARV